MPNAHGWALGNGREGRSQYGLDRVCRDAGLAWDSTNVGEKGAKKKSKGVSTTTLLSYMENKPKSTVGEIDSMHEGRGKNLKL